VGNTIRIDFREVRKFTRLESERKTMNASGVQLHQTQAHPSDESSTCHAEAQAVARMTNRSLAGGKLKPVSQEDPELLAKSECCRGRGETLLQFFARTGLSATQLRAMGREELIAFVDRTAQHDPPPDTPRRMFERAAGPKPPFKIFIT
jgi:hypothetical protein